MSTQAQIDANRANAEHSTGPVTPEGKAASSQNRASHRLSLYAGFKVLPWEIQSEFLSLTCELKRNFAVANDAESDIVVRMAEHEWMRRRALRLQEATFIDERSLNTKNLALFMRYESQHERAYNSCVNQLLKLRADKRSTKIGSEREAHRKLQVEQRTQRHENMEKARQIEIECKIVRTLRNAANNPEALEAARDIKTRHQAA